MNRPVTRVASMSGVCRPDGGSSPSRTAKTYLSRKARKNTGTAMPISENTIAPLSSDAAPALGRHVAERDAERQRQDHRADGQLDRGAEPGEEDVDARRCRARPRSTDRSCPAAPGRGNLKYCTKIVLVQAEHRGQLGALLRGGAIAEHCGDRAAGQAAQPEKQQQRQHEQHEHQLDQPADRVPQHGQLTHSRHSRSAGGHARLRRHRPERTGGRTRCDRPATSAHRSAAGRSISSCRP